MSKYKNKSPKVILPPTGGEIGLTEIEQAIQDNVRRFAIEVMRPTGIKLDELSPDEAIAADSPYWLMLGQFAELGLTPSVLAEMPREEQGRLIPIIYEELGYGDSGLAVSLAAGSLVSLMAHHYQNQAMIELSEGKLGCWAITEPDHGSDTLDYNRQNVYPGSDYDRPNCTVTIDGDELVINGQKSAWVSNGVIAQVAVLFAACDSGSGVDARNGAIVVVPLDEPGVSRGKSLDKVGQRALNQGEVYFENVRLSKTHLLVGPEGYEAGTYAILADANMVMGAIFTGQARAAYELAVQYTNERKVGGTLLKNHQYTKLRIFEMFRKVEASRALNRRAFHYNFNAPVPAIQISIASKVTATQAALDVCSEALQVFGGNGLTKEYPLEKMWRDARASLIEDGCNETLGMKAGGYLTEIEG
ncbi:acyl-CoA dehydrogenase [Pseudomonas sp. MPC6]|uniref:acyl-CoA dehydrogenase family protein n=1 Tax=unclassified Pseudomonas TaxID=196821 RepID=UPI00111050B5|nr:acyl-CoA dehydrogenase [Pseudomonas sp. MPC6]QCY09449.1 acyl-CoA dehydrogenase [Pseudomonas sp. MPC6]